MLAKFKTHEELISDEENTLAIYATKNNNPNAVGRAYNEDSKPNLIRTEFQRDRDRIIYSNAFRRLNYKTQLFVPHLGDHFRTRLTHSIEVSQIARTIGKIFGLNLDLIEAIALGHDLGHTPFGHVGERTLNSLSAELGGFKHNYQSIRVIDFLEKKYKSFFGLNLTFAVREGILKHTNLTNKVKIGRKPWLNNIDETQFMLKQNFSCTLEGQTVAVADEVAQIATDIEDGYISKNINITKFDYTTDNETRLVKNAFSFAKEDLKDSYSFKHILFNLIINYLVNDIITQSKKNIDDYYKNKEEYEFVNKILICFSDDVQKQYDNMRDYIIKWIRNAEDIRVRDNKANYVLAQLYDRYYKEPIVLPKYFWTRLGFMLNKNAEELEKIFINKEFSKRSEGDKAFKRAIIDYIAGFSDRYAEDEFEKLFISLSRMG